MSIRAASRETLFKQLRKNTEKLLVDIPQNEETLYKICWSDEMIWELLTTCMVTYSYAPLIINEYRLIDAWMIIQS